MKKVHSPESISKLLKYSRQPVSDSAKIRIDQKDYSKSAGEMWKMRRAERDECIELKKWIRVKVTMLYEHDNMQSAQLNLNISRLFEKGN